MFVFCRGICAKFQPAGIKVHPWKSNPTMVNDNPIQFSTWGLLLPMFMFIPSFTCVVNKTLNLISWISWIQSFKNLLHVQQKEATHQSSPPPKHSRAPQTPAARRLPSETITAAFQRTKLEMRLSSKPPRFLCYSIGSAHHLAVTVTTTGYYVFEYRSPPLPRGVDPSYPPLFS